MGPGEVHSVMACLLPRRMCAASALLQARGPLRLPLIRCHQSVGRAACEPHPPTNQQQAGACAGGNAPQACRSARRTKQYCCKDAAYRPCQSLPTNARVRELLSRSNRCWRAAVSLGPVGRPARGGSRYGSPAASSQNLCANCERQVVLGKVARRLLRCDNSLNMLAARGPRSSVPAPWEPTTNTAPHTAIVRLQHLLGPC